MTSSLTITKQLSSSNTWEVKASVSKGGTLPLDIFIYENSGKNYLGKYVGVCSIEQYQRFQTFDKSVIPIFGNRYVKFVEANALTSTEKLAAQIIESLVHDVKLLSNTLSEITTTTTTISIP
jgi:hypothetical protein